MGLGVALVSYADALPYLQRKALLRVLPGWHVDGGMISVYYPAQKLLPSKTRAFVDFIIERFRSERLERILTAD